MKVRKKSSTGWILIKKDYVDFTLHYDKYMQLKNPSPKKKKDLISKFNKTKIILSKGCGNIVKDQIRCPYPAAREKKMLYCKKCNCKIRKLDRLSLIIMMLK